MKQMRLRGGVFLIAAAAVCFAAPALASDDWLDVDVSGLFVLSAPRDTTVVERSGGGDSRTGRIVGPGFQLEYDLGLYSNPLADRRSKPGHRSRPLEIDGRPASLVTHDLQGVGARFIGVHVADIGMTPLGALRLTVTGTVERMSHVEDVERIYRSIRITRPDRGSTGAGEAPSS